MWRMNRRKNFSEWDDGKEKEEEETPKVKKKKRNIKSYVMDGVRNTNEWVKPTLFCH